MPFSLGHDRNCPETAGKAGEIMSGDRILPAEASQPASQPGPQDGSDGQVPASTSLETPSGKNETTENFPVGSFLLPKKLRPHVAKFYAFARAADDIADDSALSPEEKVARLDRFEDALVGRDTTDPALVKSHNLRISLAETNVSPQHGIDLLAAFKLDAVKPRTESWEDLMAYCRLSASPVGRYLLDLHGERQEDWWASDALCDALQVINHLQDCKDDLHDIDRVYIPADWLQARGLDETALQEPASSPELRQVLDQCITGTRGLLEKARQLPSLLKDRRLAAESAVIVRIADRLTNELARRDPLAEKVKLSKPQLLSCTLSGIGEGILGKRPRR